MDFAEAKVFSDSLLKGGPIAGWDLQEFMAHGKSAVIMRARRDGATAVLKVFHTGLIQQYGREAQLIRVGRERGLIENGHANLARILDAGSCESTGHVFVAMEAVPGQQLSRVLRAIPRTNIAALIEQLARAAKHLEDLGLTHRDIKPDNIHVANESLSLLVLLDFGVLKPHGDDSATSQQVSKAFVGTHQYSPPEMIHGREEDTVDGWRAITFYQLGAVLHDLITRSPLFAYATARHADLVAAIDNDIVVVEAADVETRLCNLATRCLLKSPGERLALVRWEDFMFSEIAAERPSLEARKDALLRQLQLGRVLAKADPIESAEVRRLRDLRLARLVKAARAQFDGALAALDGLAPPRSTTVGGHAYPGIAVTYTFAAFPGIQLISPFRVQLALEVRDDRSIIDVFVRASKGLDDTEVGWSHLMTALETLDGTCDALQEYMLAIISEMAGE